MKKTINEKQFIQAFDQMGRGNQFSEEALKELFDYLSEIENDSGEEIELDVVALCCEFVEYDSLKECVNEEGISLDEDEEVTFETLSQHINVIAELSSGGVLVCVN